MNRSAPMRMTAPGRASRAIALVFMVLSLILTVGAARAEDHRPLRFGPSNIFEIHFAFDPQISPDGGRVVYTRQYSDVMTDMRYSNLWIVNSDGTGHRPLTGGRHRDRNARWSPDGKRLVYVSDRDGAPQLFVLDLASGESQRITMLPGAVAKPTWSPDGRRISFFSEVAVEPVRMVTMPQRPIGANWREGATIHTRLNYRREQLGNFRGFSQLFVVAADGGEPVQLSRGDFNYGSTATAEWDEASGSAWTQDGSRIIVTANRRPDAELEESDTELFEFRSDRAGEPRALTDRRGPDHTALLSPDGSRLAYLGYDDERFQHQSTRLYVARPDGSGSRLESGALDAGIRAPQWAPDGKGLYFLYDRHGRSYLGYHKLGGRVADVLSNVGAGYMNYGFAGSYSMARTGEIAFTEEDAHTVGAIAVWDPRTRRTRRIVDLNRAWLDRTVLAEVEEIWFESSHDRRRIQGWIMKPPGFDPKRKYPLILEIHGGPNTNIGGDRFDIEKQIYAANGYVVLFMNPRGSTSYGEEFIRLIHHKYPGDDYFDLMSGVDAVIARGYVDERNLFVTGGSGGGVLTCWTIGRTQRFAGAVAQYGYVNAVSQTLSSDIPFIASRWFPGPPWEHPQAYWERSPLSLVGSVSTPTMMMVGLDEVRAPPWESEQYFKALKLRGIDAALTFFPDEPHGIRIYPSHHAEKVLTIMAWFERHKR